MKISIDNNKYEKIDIDKLEDGYYLLEDNKLEITIMLMTHDRNKIYFIDNGSKCLTYLYNQDIQDYFKVHKVRLIRKIDKISFNQNGE